MNKYSNCKHNGFSLVEIMVVILLMAILTGGATMILGNNAENARFSVAQNDLDILQQAFIQYYNVVGNFAGTVAADLSGAFASETVTINGTTLQKINVLQSFISKDIITSPLKDPWDSQYKIGVSSDADLTNGKGTIVVYCAGGTEDIIVGGKTIVSGGMKKDTTSSTPMYRIIYNVEY